MKLTVEQWTRVQAHLPDERLADDKPDYSKPGNALWQKIEERTWAKRYQQNLAIKLTKDEQKMVDEAMTRVTGREQVLR